MSETVFQRLGALLSSPGVRGVLVVLSCHSNRLEHAAVAPPCSFQERFLERVRQEGHSSTNFHRPAFLAATFFLCSRKMRQSVDKRKLAREVGCNSKEFSEVGGTAVPGSVSQQAS